MGGTAEHGEPVVPDEARDGPGHPESLLVPRRETYWGARWLLKVIGDGGDVKVKGFLTGDLKIPSPKAIVG